MKMYMEFDVVSTGPVQRTVQEGVETQQTNRRFALLPTWTLQEYI